MDEFCENCCFSMDVNSDNSVLCRRYPPKITKVEGPVVTSHYPFPAKKWWCGEWKRRVNGTDLSAMDTTISRRRKS